MEQLLDQLLVELRRGTITLAVLSQLRQPQYGYSLVQVLEQKNSAVEAGTLYPMLRRLEKQGILRSEWDTSESRPRKYYLLSDTGEAIYERLRTEWRVLTAQMSALLIEGVESDEPN